MIPVDLLELPFTGTVLRPFPFWFNPPINESWQYMTNVITADDGTEQRVAVRNPARPRHVITANVVAFERDEAQHLESVLYGWNRYTYGVPQWQDEMVLTASCAPDDTSVTVDDTTGRDLAQRLVDEEDVPVMLWKAHDDYEVVLLAAVDDDTTLSFVGPVARDWPVGTKVLSLQLMVLPAQVEIQRPARAMALATLEFTSGQVPLGVNQPCGEDGENQFAVRVQMVRVGGGLTVPKGIGLVADHNADNSPGPMPVPPAAADLFGFTRAVDLSAIVTEGYGGMWEGSKGKVSGFSKCTPKVHPDFRKMVIARGIGTTIGTDCAIGLFAEDVAGIPDLLPLEVASSFSGTGYAPAPSAPTTRQFTVGAMTLAGGIYHRNNVPTVGDLVSSYGRYDPMVMGGIANYTIFPAVSPNTIVLELAHGFAFRCRGIADFKGVKVVTENVINPTDDYEDWTYDDPEVTTHDFTMDDYTAADVGVNPLGAFVNVPCGGSTLWGNGHDGGSAAGDGNGFQDIFENEWARVTVYLYDVDDVDTFQWVDTFRTMFVSMEIVP